MNFREFVDNDAAIAYGWMMLLLYFGGAIAIWFGWTYMIDILLYNVINPEIARGTMSLQAVTAGTWNVNVAKFAPPLILILGFVYGVNRAIYSRGRSI